MNSQGRSGGRQATGLSTLTCSGAGRGWGNLLHVQTMLPVPTNLPGPPANTSEEQHRVLPLQKSVEDSLLTAG